MKRRARADTAASCAAADGERCAVLPHGALWVKACDAMCPAVILTLLRGMMRHGEALAWNLTAARRACMEA